MKFDRGHQCPLIATLRLLVCVVGASEPDPNRAVTVSRPRVDSGRGLGSEGTLTNLCLFLSSGAVDVRAGGKVIASN